MAYHRESKVIQNCRKIRYFTPSYYVLSIAKCFNSSFDNSIQSHLQEKNNILQSFDLMCFLRYLWASMFIFWLRTLVQQWLQFNLRKNKSRFTVVQDCWQYKNTALVDLFEVDFLSVKISQWLRKWLKWHHTTTWHIFLKVSVHFQFISIGQNQWGRAWKNPVQASPQILGYLYKTKIHQLSLTLSYFWLPFQLTSEQNMTKVLE